MSKEWMLKTLINLGFTESETQVYIFLVTEGPKRARDIADALKIHRRQLYYALEKLRRKGIVNPSSECPARFSAVSFDKVLDLFIKAGIEEQETLQASKEELLSTWWSIIKKNGLQG